MEHTTTPPTDKKIYAAIAMAAVALVVGAIGLIVSLTQDSQKTIDNAPPQSGGSTRQLSPPPAGSSLPIKIEGNMNSEGAGTMQDSGS